MPLLWIDQRYGARAGIELRQHGLSRVSSRNDPSILKGAKPGDLPVQLPTKFKFTVNRKTASARGIDVPLGILLAADEVIE